MQFLVLFITLAPLVWFGWNLEWTTVSVHHWWWVYFQGQKGHIKARWATFWPLFENFSIHSDSPFSKLQEFEKKSSKKFIPRPVAFKTTLSFGFNFLCSYPSDFNQIQIMWPFWPKLPFYEKTLAFKGHQGQERPSNFFQPNLAEQNFIAKSFILENMHFLFSEHSHIVACKGVYFTSAWPCWPLKAKIFSSKHFFLYNW